MTMTAQEKQALIGKYATIHTGTVEEAKVSITDVRDRYGKVDVFIHNGHSGKSAWRQLDGVKIITQQ